MVKRLSIALALLGVLVPLIFGCAPAPAPAPAPTPPAATVAPTAAGAAVAKATAPSGEPIVIGLVTEATGPQTSTGDNQTNAIKLAVDEWNGKGGIKGRPIKLVVEDNASTPPGTVTAFNKVIAEQKPVAMFVSTFANNVMAIEPAIRTAGLPAITAASGPGVTAAGNPWIFRMRTNDIIMGQLAAEYAVKEMGAKKIGILYVTGEMGAGASKVVKEHLEKLGVPPVGVESYNPDDKDVTAQLLNLQKAGAELVIGWGYPPDAAMVMTNMQRLGVKMKLLGSPAFGIADALKLAKEAANGNRAMVDWALSDDAAQQDWAKRIEARAKLPANFIQSTYYDAANILFQSIERAGTSPQALRDALRSVKGYKGITGEYSFDEKGDGLRQAYVVELKDGKAVILKSVKMP